MVINSLAFNLTQVLHGVLALLVCVCSKGLFHCKGCPSHTCF